MLLFSASTQWVPIVCLHSQLTESLAADAWWNKMTINKTTNQNYRTVPPSHYVNFLKQVHIKMYIVYLHVA